MRIKYRDSEGRTGELRRDQVEVGDLVAFTKIGGGWTQGEIVEVLPDQLRVRAYDAPTASPGSSERLVAWDDCEVQLNAADPRIEKRVAAWEIDVLLRETAAPIGHWPVALVEFTRRARRDTSWRDLARLAWRSRREGWQSIVKQAAPTLKEYVDWALDAVGDDFKDEHGRTASPSSRSDALLLLARLEAMARSPLLEEEWKLVESGDELLFEEQQIEAEQPDWEAAADEIAEARETLFGMTDEEWGRTYGPHLGGGATSPAVQDARERARAPKKKTTPSAEVPLVASAPGYGGYGRYRAEPGLYVYDRAEKATKAIAEVLDADRLKLDDGSERDAAEVFVAQQDRESWRPAPPEEVERWRSERRKRRRTAAWRARQTA